MLRRLKRRKVLTSTSGFVLMQCSNAATASLLSVSASQVILAKAVESLLRVKCDRKMGSTLPKSYLAVFLVSLVPSCVGQNYKRLLSGLSSHVHDGEALVYTESHRVVLLQRQYLLKPQCGSRILNLKHVALKTCLGFWVKYMTLPFGKASGFWCSSSHSLCLRYRGLAKTLSPYCNFRSVLRKQSISSS